MSCIITDKCIKCKYTNCADVCPVNCFYEGKNMLVINPNECIDCNICISECPVEAIKKSNIINHSSKWFFLNKKYSYVWHKIKKKRRNIDFYKKYINCKYKFYQNLYIK